MRNKIGYRVVTIRGKHVAGIPEPFPLLSKVYFLIPPGFALLAE
jgi:hypothetical protein